MTFLVLPEPDWKSLIGGSDEAAWLAARDRKVAIAAELGAQVRETAEALAAIGRSFECSAEVLKSLPGSGEWFISLAGFADKTLSNIRIGPRKFGLELAPSRVAKRLKDGRVLSDGVLEAFSNWINSELNLLYPMERRDPALALATVLLVLGGRVQGQVQNMAGDDAIVLLKTLLVGEMEKRGVAVAVSETVDTWIDYTPELNLLKQSRIRLRERMVCEFISGGNRPDIKIFVNGIVTLVGEVKGRKDLSNVWESWMPQITGHLRTWAMEQPDAARVFFGTVITSEMIEGITAAGTHHAGLRVLYRNGMLNGAYNLSRITEKEVGAVREFDVLLDALQALAR